MPLTTYSDPEVLFRSQWDAARQVDWDGTPQVATSFVAESGPRLWVVDVRNHESMIGPLGHIPGVWRMPLERIGEIRAILGHQTPTVLVCDDGRRSRIAARFLKELGMETVAAMDGGMVQWKLNGYGVSRDSRGLEAFLEAPRPGHGSNGSPLVKPSSGKHLTRHEIVEHVGEAHRVRRMKLAAIFTADQMSCVDGREDRAIIGTPGGDAGALLLDLAAAESLGADRVNLEQMPLILRAYADANGGLYMHTDNHALNRLIRALRDDPKVGPEVESFEGAETWTAFLRSPPTELRAVLLDHLAQPDHVGCGHLKLSMIRPDDYRIRTPIIESFLVAFYRALWSGAPDMHWAVLGGDHREGAVVNVELDDGPVQFHSMIPMIAPSVGGVQMFVNHPQVVEALHEQEARFMHSQLRNVLPLGKTGQTKVRGAISELGGVQGLATLKSLAAGLPTFTIRFDFDGDFEVIEGNPIPSA